MMILRIIALLLSLGGSVATYATTTGLPWSPLQGKIDFTQIKQLQGLPVPLKSSGYLDISETAMLWHTTTPVQSKLMISAAGVSQWQQQDYVAIAGSEFVGQLMLAVLRQDNNFIQRQFEITQTDTHCMQLTPTQAPLDKLFSNITLCGETTLSQLSLYELNGNTSNITLQPQTALP